MFTRRVATAVLLTFVGLATAIGGTAQARRSAVAMKVFTSKQFGYTLSYPATWRVVPTPNVDIQVEAPDTDARMVGQGINAGISTADLRQAVDTTIQEVSKTAAIRHATRVIHGVAFQEGQVTYTTSRGIKDMAVVLAASQHQRTYLFFGIVALGAPATHRTNPRAQEEIAQIQASFASITIAQ